MSGPERLSESLVPTTSLKRKQFSDEDKGDLEKLDDIFKRIKKAVPHTPYVLSTPSLYPYQYHSRHESHAWMMGHLFRPDEEHLQYRTFQYREPYQDCFTLMPGEEEEPEASRPKSQPATAANQAPKKKISLSDYKSKQANGVITPGSKKPSPSLQPTKQNSGLATQAKSSVKPSATSTQKSERPSGHNRSHSKEIAPIKPETHFRDDTSAAPPQKAGLTGSKTTNDTSEPSNATPHGLPPLLSPVDESLPNPYGLPAILSPTLPSNIQAELDKIETQRSRADSNTSTSSSDRRSKFLKVPDVTSKNDEISKGPPRKRAATVNEKSPVAENTNNSDDPESSLLVKLKYTTKKTQDAIKGVLTDPAQKEASNEKKEHKDQPKIRPVQIQPKSVDSTTPKSKIISKTTARRAELPTSTTKAPVPTIKTAEKRPRSEDDVGQIPPKRPRASSMQDRPITPKEQIVVSPMASNKSSAQRGQATLSTPRKDLKAMNMLRTTSAEGYDSTPGRSGTSLGHSKHVDGKASTSALINSKKQTDITLLQHTSMKLNQMGRSLKHEGQKLEHEKGGKFGKDDQKRAAVIGLECILSYMAAYHAQDSSLHLRGRPAEVEGTWKTLLPLCSSYARLTKDFQHLDGFRSYLGAVIAANICTLVAPRAPNPKAHDSPHELSHAELAKQHSHLTENLGLLSDHYMKLLRHTQDARSALPMEDIEKQYSKTWSGAEINGKLAKNTEKVSATKLSGPYFLPIQNDTTPIQAVRFGLKFLAEYCDKERVEHHIKVNLDRPE